MTKPEPATPCILIVDDEPDMVWAIGIAMKSDGHCVSSATSGAEAVDLLAQVSFDIVFVDAMLPDWDGMDLAALIHQQQPRAAIILVSGYYYEEDATVMEGLQTGLYAGFVAKPFELEDIRRQVRLVLERHLEV
jgi:DNA-binding response OmpR family regulator